MCARYTRDGTLTLEGIERTLSAQQKREIEFMDQTKQDPYTVCTLAMVYSSLEEKARKRLVAATGNRMMGQQERYQVEKLRILKDPLFRNEWVLLRLFFTLLERCPTTIAVNTVNPDTFPPLSVSLINAMLDTFGQDEP